MQNCVLIGDRNDLVRTPYGHSVGFRKGEPTEIPNIPAVIKACLDRGHKRQVETAQEVLEESPEPEHELEAPAKRGRPKRVDI